MNYQSRESKLMRCEKARRLLKMGCNIVQTLSRAQLSRDLLREYLRTVGDDITNYGARKRARQKQACPSAT